jgi:hypothetical protein
MDGIVCDTCGEEWPLDRFNLSCKTPETCFRCRSRGVGFAFQGSQPDGQRTWWNNKTVKESVRDITEGFAERNGGVQPVPATKTYYGL